MLKTRLSNQRLTQTKFSQAEDVVSWLGAMQAQDYLGAKWGLGLRARDVTDDDIEQAFTEGRILRTHVLRPTWHFVTEADIRWMVALTGPRIQRINRSYGYRFGLDDRTFTRARVVIERALEGGRYLTRPELAGELARARIAARAQRLAFLVADVELVGAICSGPRRGLQFTYALVAERAPKARQLSRDESLAELARRFFQSHGPATVRDFSWWSGLTVRDARTAVALARVDVLAEPPRLDRVRGATYLLPNYDEYLIAYKDRGAVLDPKHARNLGIFTNVELPHHVVVDGRVAGSWRRRLTDTAVAVDVRPYAALSAAAVRRLRTEARKFGRFLDRDAELHLC